MSLRHHIPPDFPELPKRLADISKEQYVDWRKRMEEWRINLAVATEKYTKEQTSEFLKAHGVDFSKFITQDNLAAASISDYGYGKDLKRFLESLICEINCGSVVPFGWRVELRCLGATSATLCKCDQIVIASRLAKGSTSAVTARKFKATILVEAKAYSGGSNDSKWFQTGGTPEINTHNIYSLKIADPFQIYYLNRAHGSKVGAKTFLDEYEFTVLARGGTVMELKADSVDGHQISNHQGHQFVQLDEI